MTSTAMFPGDGDPAVMEFQRFDVYRVALEFQVLVPRLVTRRGDASLRDQLDRASASILLNIAESYLAASGRSRVPRTCSSVDFPTPEAPTTGGNMLAGGAERGQEGARPSPLRHQEGVRGAALVQEEADVQVVGIVESEGHGQAARARVVQEDVAVLGLDDTYFVQTARLHAVQGRKEEALRELTQGIALGHGELRHIADDPDFDALRSEAEFRRLVSR